MKSAPIRLTIIGAAGRMGKSVVDVAQNDPEIQIAALCDLGDSIESGLKNSDVAIDFSQAESLEEICRAALHHRKPLVIGTTGHSQRQREILEETGRSVAIVLATNFSVGVNVLFRLTRKTAE
jgi:4-hydroxy-tetrahydrodipicolinate reductase